MPAFRVVVNSASVHGSIGYSTNLFPAMTLGCGAPGGNITSDNIGPQHLMNVKRIAWEARGVEHRTVPADQRLAGAAMPAVPEAVQDKVNPPAAPAAAHVPSAPHRAIETKPEETIIVTTAAHNATGSADRAAIARVVASVLEAQGIPRGKGVPSPVLAPAAESSPAPAPKETPSAASIAAEIADRFFGSSAMKKTQSPEKLLAPEAVGASKLESPLTPAPLGSGAKMSQSTASAPIEIQVFVSENDVRRAMTRSEKIFIGRKTILTPSARDIGMEHEVFVETETGSIR